MFSFLKNTELKKALDEKEEISAKLKDCAEDADFLRRQLEHLQSKLDEKKETEQRELILAKEHLSLLNSDIEKTEEKISKNIQIIRITNLLLNIYLEKSRKNLDNSLQNLKSNFENTERKIEHRKKTLRKK